VFDDKSLRELAVPNPYEGLMACRMEINSLSSTTLIKGEYVML
jgi:hypothetical protein